MPKASPNHQSSRTAWLIVASRTHIERGRAGGFAQVNHGRRAGLDRMQIGDRVICYAPTIEMAKPPKATGVGARTHGSFGKRTKANTNPTCPSVQALEHAAVSPPGPKPTPLKAFVALGTVSSEVYQCEEDGWRPFRRGVVWDGDATAVSLERVKTRLKLCSDKHWGYRLRAGLVPLEASDLEMLEAAMRSVKRQ